MKSLYLDGIEDWCRAHTTPVDPIYDRLREETLAGTKYPQMQVGHLEGRFLKLLAQLTHAKTVVEVGTFTGYSALSMAEGLAEGGEVHTFDVDADTTAIARRFWSEAPWGRRIHLHLGDARANLPAFLKTRGPIDLAFVDADKSGYVTYWDAIVPALRPGGLVVADNVLWSGDVLDPKTPEDHAIVAFDRHAAKDPRVELVMLTIRDGMIVARKR